MTCDYCTYCQVIKLDNGENAYYCKDRDCIVDILEPPCKDE